MIYRVTPVQYGRIGWRLVQVVYVEYCGGGECFEYILHGILSDNGYGNPTAALIDAYLHALTGPLDHEEVTP